MRIVACGVISFACLALPAQAEDRPNQELLREHLASVQAVRSQN